MTLKKVGLREWGMLGDGVKKGHSEKVTSEQRPEVRKQQPWNI